MIGGKKGEKAHRRGSRSNGEPECRRTARALVEDEIFQVPLWEHDRWRASGS